jgi:NADPH2:quinone reductase
MKIDAVVATATGGPDVLKVEAVDLPWPAGSHDVLVRLKAAALNPADSFFRQLGGYVSGPHPFVLGHDGAGVVEAAGSSVTRVKPGDRVAFCNGGIGATMGTYAQAAVVREAQLAKIADGGERATATDLPLVAITAWESLFDRARLEPGEHVLIHAGAGGTGHMAVQLAKLKGAKVAATVSSTEKAAFVRGLGADIAIDYRREDVVAAALAWSGGGVDVALDNVGAEAMQATYRAMAPYGRIVTLMGTPGDDADMTAYNRNLSIINEMMLTPMWFGLTGRLAAQARIIGEALALVAAGRLTPHIAARFPWREAAAAHERLDLGGAIGKIVLEME